MSKKKAQSAKHEAVPVWQVPVVLNRDKDNVIGVLTLDPSKVPSGSDWGLQPGVDVDDKIILFSTMKKGERSKLTK